MNDQNLKIIKKELKTLFMKILEEYPVNRKATQEKIKQRFLDKIYEFIERGLLADDTPRFNFDVQRDPENPNNVNFIPKDDFTKDLFLKFFSNSEDNNADQT